MEFQPRDWARMFSVVPNNQHWDAVVPASQFSYYNKFPVYNDQLSRHFQPIEPMTSQKGEQNLVIFPSISPFPQFHPATSAYRTQHYTHGYGYTNQTFQSPVVQVDEPLVPEKQRDQQLVIQGNKIHHVAQGLLQPSVEYSSFLTTPIDNGFACIPRKEPFHCNVLPNQSPQGVIVQESPETDTNPNLTDDGKQANILYRALRLKMKGILSDESHLSTVPLASTIPSSKESDTIVLDCLEESTDWCSGNKNSDNFEGGQSLKEEELFVSKSMSADHALVLGLNPTEGINRPTVWLNVTLQLDTSHQIKNGQPTTQHRSLITNIVTRLVYPSNTCPQEDTDMVNAAVTYDERGRFVVIEVDFITAGIFQVISDTGSKSHPTFTRSVLKSVILKKIESIDSLEPRSQYVILGDLCPVPKGVQKCHRNAKPLCRKLMEYIYTQEFRKYTLPLLIAKGEEDVWTETLKLPRTRSRISDYKDLAAGRQLRKRRSLSPVAESGVAREIQQNIVGDLETTSRKRRRKPTDSSASSASSSPSVSLPSSPSHISNPAPTDLESALFVATSVTSSVSEGHPDHTWLLPSQTSAPTSPSQILADIPMVFSPISPPVLMNEVAYERSYGENAPLSPPLLEPIVVNRSNSSGQAVHIDPNEKSSHSVSTLPTDCSPGKTMINSNAHSGMFTWVTDYSGHNPDTGRCGQSTVIDYTNEFPEKIVMDNSNWYGHDAAVDYRPRWKRNEAVDYDTISSPTGFSNYRDKYEQEAPLDLSKRSELAMPFDYTKISQLTAHIDYRCTKRSAYVDYSIIPEQTAAIDYRCTEKSMSSDYVDKSKTIEQKFVYSEIPEQTEWALGNCLCGCNSV